MASIFHENAIILCLILTVALICPKVDANSDRNREIEVNGGPNSVVWVVQISDLHFSIHHPDRARDFNNAVGPVLSFVNPSLVLITGDLTDGKSKDLLTMKQDEKEWVEYRNVMEDVVRTSGLDKSRFYDLRGNHDNFGVPSVNSSLDFFSNYSLNAQAGRGGKVNSVTLQTEKRRHLFVGIDTTMAVGLRGPSNLFGHPTDELLAELDSELSQWDTDHTKPVTKISFGHFPLSFSATSESGRSLTDIFLKHSISAYLCGHLHTRFGKNLKRNHQVGGSLIQLNMHHISSKNFSNEVQPVQEFWEWEMGDWRKSRAMRIVAIDRGKTSFIDIDLKLGVKKTIILPTFPLDSRLMWTSSLLSEYEDQSRDPSYYLTVRALVFSSSPIVSVMARVYDSNPGHLIVVMEAAMTKIKSDPSRGALYAVPWNFKAFEDRSPDRYWLQIEATDIRGRSTVTDMRPFSINGVRNFLSWTWTEFVVMGCQWSALYFPILWFCIGCFLLVLLIPVALCSLSKKKYTMQNFSADRRIINGIGWVLTELYKVRYVWFGFLGYIFYLVLFPWLYGRVFTDVDSRGYMTYKGWVVKHPESGKKLEYLGVPDIMVIVIPHLVFIVFPSLLVAIGFAVEREMYKGHLLVLSGKKEDDYRGDFLRSRQKSSHTLKSLKWHVISRWMRKLLMVVCLVIMFKHIKSCRSLIKAYEMNPLLHFPIYSLSIPLLLAYTIHTTSRV